MPAHLYSGPTVLSLLGDAKHQPHDDAPRLVLADWLEEHGDPDRAEFIRLQLRLAPGADINCDVQRSAERRCQHLLDRHGGSWLGPLWSHCLTLAEWHRGLLSIGLSRRVSLECVTELLPWIDTAVFRVSSRKDLEYAGDVLSRSSLSHACLEVRVAQRGDRLLGLFASLPELPCLRTFGWDWPLKMLRRSVRDELPNVVPAVSDAFLVKLLSEMPAIKHLTHLSSSPAWSDEQALLIRSIGVEPVRPGWKLWMHAGSPARFRDRMT